MVPCLSGWLTKSEAILRNASRRHDCLSAMNRRRQPGSGDIPVAVVVTAPEANIPGKAAASGSPDRKKSGAARVWRRRQECRRSLRTRAPERLGKSGRFIGSKRREGEGGAARSLPLFHPCTTETGFNHEQSIAP